MLYLIFIIESELHLASILNNVIRDFVIGKSLCLVKQLLNFLFLCAQGKLIATNFALSNNHFGVNNSSFSSLNLIILLRKGRIFNTEMVI